MLSRPFTTRLLYGALVLGLAAVVVGMPLVSLAYNSQSLAFLFAESEETSDGESDGAEWELFELFPVSGDDRLPTGSAVTYRSADRSAGRCHVLADPHLQRGPPDC